LAERRAQTTTPFTLNCLFSKPSNHVLGGPEEVAAGFIFMALFSFS